MKKLLFFDIDGTLAIPGRPPSEATVGAIRTARKNGHRAILSTGRAESVVPPAVREIGFDGGIYSAGGRIVVGDQVLLDRTMPPAMSDRILAAIREEDLWYALECLSGTYRSREDFLLPPESEGGSSELQRLTTESNWQMLQDYPGDPIYKISFQAESREQMERLARRLGSEVSLVCFENMIPGISVLAGEVSDRAVDKGMALRKVCAHFGASPGDAIAFGDSMNDAGMLREAGVGVAMGNAPEEVRALADQVCESCDADGVAKALARMGLLA